MPMVKKKKKKCCSGDNHWEVLFLQSPLEGTWSLGREGDGTLVCLLVLLSGSQILLPLHPGSVSFFLPSPPSTLITSDLLMFGHHPSWFYPSSSSSHDTTQWCLLCGALLAPPWAQGSWLLCSQCNVFLLMSPYCTVMHWCTCLSPQFDCAVLKYKNSVKQEKWKPRQVLIEEPPFTC